MPTVGPPKHPRPEEDADLRELVQLQPPKLADTQDVPHGPTSAWGGLGMAAYALLLLLFGLAGFAGMAGATYALLQASGSRYSELKSGAEVAVWRTQPLRDAGLIGISEVPLAWHDESAALDGTIACATTDTALLRVEPDVAVTLPFGQITAVDVEGSEEDGVTVRIHGGEGPISCTFGPQEGGTRFGRQLRAAAGLPLDGG